MIFSVIAFFTGAIFAAITLTLTHQERIRVMKVDAIHALQMQASDSYMIGWRHGVNDQKLAQKEEAIMNDLIAQFD